LKDQVFNLVKRAVVYLKTDCLIILPNKRYPIPDLRNQTIGIKTNGIPFKILGGFSAILKSPDNLRFQIRFFLVLFSITYFFHQIIEGKDDGLI
jgi:hypothetical protein